MTAAALPADTARLYLAALRADLEAALPLIWGRPVVSIFIGGGTPSLFAPEQIGELISDLRARLPLEAGCEITLEANPGTFEAEKFRGKSFLPIIVAERLLKLLEFPNRAISLLLILSLKSRNPDHIGDATDQSKCGDE